MTRALWTRRLLSKRIICSSAEIQWYKTAMCFGKELSAFIDAAPVTLKERLYCPPNLADFFFFNVERTLYKERVNVCRERLGQENGRCWCGGGKTKERLLRELFLKKVKRRLLFLRYLLMPTRLNVRGLEVLWLFLILWQLLQEKDFLFKFILLNLSKTCFLVTPEGVRSCALCWEKSWEVAA